MRFASRVVLALALSACSAELGVTVQEVSGDPVTGCGIVEPNAIAGHEATFYRCAEQTLSCGPDGYLLGYGTRYAERFYRSTRPWMSSAGKRWLDATLVCLQEKLRERIDASTSCDDVRTIAFDSHPECYVESGFCSLPLTDWFAVAATIDGRDWLSRDALRQVTTTARACLF